MPAVDTEGGGTSVEGGEKEEDATDTASESPMCLPIAARSQRLPL